MLASPPVVLVVIVLFSDVNLVCEVVSLIRIVNRKRDASVALECET